MQKGKLNVVMDGQWGSTGKGKLAAWLAFKHDVDVAVCDFQTNAGHTVVMDDGKKAVLQQLPVSVLKKGCQLLINPGATITVSKLIEEIDIYDAADRLTIHPHASIVTEECRTYERENLNRISSTLKGCGAALGMKAMRHPSVVLAKDVPELRRWIGDTTEIVNDALDDGKMVMAEAAQGFDLSLNHGLAYPFVTSRDVTTASILSNAGVRPQALGDVYGCLRTFPIRVGHAYAEDGAKIGDSGPFYPDQYETNWEEIKEISGSPTPLIEKTTVTGKVRRVFTFSALQLARFVQVCGPTHIFLNFVNHISYACYGARSPEQIPEAVMDMVAEIDNRLATMGSPARITHLGTGPTMSEIVQF